MRFLAGSAVALTLLTLIPAGAIAQDASRTVSGGGISAPGWTGKIDANEERAGHTINDAKFALSGGKFSITTGPAVTYWNPANKASGNYTVKATFTEPKFMNLNSLRTRTGFSSRERSGRRGSELSVLRGVWQRHLHRARLRSGAFPDERPARRGE